MRRLGIWIVGIVGFVAAGCTGGRDPSLRFAPAQDGTLRLSDRDFDAYARAIVRSDAAGAAALLDQGYTLADSLSAADPASEALYLFREGLADRLDGVDSPWRDAEKFALALDREVLCRSLEPADFRKINFQRERLLLNAPGRAVSDFPVEDAEGGVHHLRTLCDRKTLLFIYGPSCAACDHLSDELRSDRTLARLMDEGKVTGLALYTGEDLATFREMSGRLPGWTSVRDDGAVSFGGAFDTRMIPSLYLVSENGIVRYRGARSVREILPAITEDRLSDRRIPLEEGEKVWGGRVADGRNMPYTDGFSTTLFENSGNQVMPLLMTSAGRYVWSREPFEFRIEGRDLVVSRLGAELETAQVAEDLPGVYHFAMRTFFPPEGTLPPEEFFENPQYNTWIELQYNQNQADVLRYARGILDHGLPPGILMIDDTWMEDYGKWVFHPERFPDPKAMCDELHRMGFKVMLWVCPFVSMDQYPIWCEINSFGGFLRQPDGRVYPVEWWNGVSGELDLTNPEAVDWFDRQLRNLVDAYGVDGFKFDAGDFNLFPADAVAMEPAKPWDLCARFTAFADRYPYNEYRASWKSGGKPIVQRLHDKSHTWDALTVLLPEMMAENLLGYWFSCPDMIGGGSFASFLPGCPIDQDLIVRSAQTHALMPMMQFSVAPWRILDQAHLDAVLKAVAVRKAVLPEIIALLEKAAATGEPVVAPLEYVFPHGGYAEVRDAFMLGRDLLVAPMLDPGTVRTVVLPEGSWTADDGTVYEGGQTVEIEVPLDRIPYFRKNKH
ncbi:MAG: hypothetical protein IJ721_01320 [Bacteroidales bacterium]|nr:hypothetical protein [Bacteroidales bacterium]